MSQNPNYKATILILNDVEKHGLVQFNQEYCDEVFFNNFLEFQIAFSNSINNIASKLDPFQSNYSEMIVFMIYSQLSYINSHFCMMNIFLKIITNPTKLKGGFDENTTLSNMIKKICNKMQYSEKLKKSIRGLFLEDLRNTIIKQKYLINKKGYLEIYSNQQDLKKKLTIKDLTDFSLQLMSIFDAMIDWSNGINSKSNKEQRFDKIINEFLSEVQSLDKKLEELSK